MMPAGELLIKFLATAVKLLVPFLYATLKLKAVIQSLPVPICTSFKYTINESSAVM